MGGDSSSIKLKDMFMSIDGSLRIPDYQRGYQWKKENIFDMYQDLIRICDDSSKRHYFGTIVTSKFSREGEVKTRDI